MIQFSEEKLKEVQQIISRYPGRKAEKCCDSCVAPGAAGIWWMARCAGNGLCSFFT